MKIVDGHHENQGQPEHIILQSKFRDIMNSETLTHGFVFVTHSLQSPVPSTNVVVMTAISDQDLRHSIN